MIRAAFPDDLDHVIELAQAFIRAAGYLDDHSQVAVVDRVKETFEAAAAGHGIVLVDERQVQAGELSYQEVVGFIGGVVAVHPTTGVSTAFEFAWYVHPSARKGLGGARLLKRFELEGKLRGASLCQLSALDQQVGGFLERSGYTARETTYTKPIQ